MANELQLQTITPDATVYVLVRNPAGLVWQTTTSTFVTFVDANIGNYDVPLVEQGTSSAYYVGDFPTGITTAGVYNITAYRQAGGSPAVSDTVIGEDEFVWDGSAEAVPDTGDDLTSQSYIKTHLQIGVTTYDTTIDQFNTAASKAVVKYLGRNIKLDDYSETRNGGGKNWVRVWNTPITSITSVVYDADTDSPTTVAGNQFLFEAMTGIVKPKPFSTTAGQFADRFQNVTVNYSAGYADVPADIQSAVAMIVGIMLYTWNNATMGVTEKAVGDVKIKYADLFTPTGDLNVGHPVFGPAVSLLRPYKTPRY